MKYIQLGHSDLRLSAITYGAFAIGGNMWGGNTRKDSIDAIHASLDHGVTSIDTAPFYGFGLSEEVIGEAIKGKKRDDIQLLTKFGLVWDGSNGNKGDFFFDAEEAGKKIPVYKYAAKESVIKEVEDSLKRLRTDYIDLLQLHWPDSTTVISETMEAMDLLIQQGKIRAAGVSNYTVNQLKEASKTINLASNQVPYSMLNRGIEEEIVPYALNNDLGIIVYSPMERGLLTGKYFQESRLKDDDHRNGYFNQFDLPKIRTFLSTIEPIAHRNKATLSQLVLQWTSLQPAVSVVLAGARNSEQAIANAQAFDFKLSDEDLLFINNALYNL